VVRLTLLWKESTLFTPSGGDRKSTGSNFGCTLRCEFFSHSFSQSSSEGNEELKEVDG
jgi:hypothetical protein